MNARQYADLEAVMHKWIEDHCEDDDWDVVIGNRTAEMMATAARAVFDACHESQQYAKRQGL